MDERDARVTFAALAESVGARLREYGLKGSTVQISLRDRTPVSYTHLPEKPDAHKPQQVFL